MSRQKCHKCTVFIPKSLILTFQKSSTNRLWLLRSRWITGGVDWCRYNIPCAVSKANYHSFNIITTGEDTLLMSGHVIKNCESCNNLWMDPFAMYSVIIQISVSIIQVPKNFRSFTSLVSTVSWLPAIRLGDEESSWWLLLFWSLSRTLGSLTEQLEVSSQQSWFLSNPLCTLLHNWNFIEFSFE